MTTTIRNLHMEALQTPMPDVGFVFLDDDKGSIAEKCQLLTAGGAHPLVAVHDAETVAQVLQDLHAVVLKVPHVPSSGDLALIQL